LSTNPKNKFDLFLQGTVIVTLNSKYGLYEFNTCLINTTPWFIEFFFNNVLDLSNVNILENHNTEGFSNVLNKNITTDVYIDSNEKRQGVNDNKVDYYLDAGHPTLTCIVSPEGDYNYHWTVVPARGKAESRESS
jgi:hypothetical protein